MKRSFKSLLLLLLFVPCLFFMTACGNIKEVANKTFVFAKCEVTGNISKTTAENLFKDYFLKFTDEEFMVYSSESEPAVDTYTYTFSGDTITGVNVNDSSQAVYKVSGEYIVVEIAQNSTDSVKVFFKEK